MKQLEKIIGVLIMINIMGAYCLDGIPFVGTIVRALMMLLIVCSLFYSVRSQQTSSIITILSFVFVVYCFTLKEHIEGEWSRMLGIHAQTAITVFLCTMVFLASFKYSNCASNRFKLIKTISFSGALLAAVTFFAVGPSNLLNIHSDAGMALLARFSLHPTPIGICFAISLLTSVYCYQVEKTRTCRNLILINAIFLFLSGSRRALLFGILGIALYFVFSGNNKQLVKRLIYSSVFLIVVYTAVMNIPFLYEFIGYRLDSLLDVVGGGSGSDTTKTRMIMVEFGLEMISNNPWYGSGFNAFATTYGSIYGNEVYSHNNFIELTVSGGLILLIIYYSKFILTIGNLLKRIHLGKEHCLLLTLLIVLIISDIAAVTFYYRIYYIVFAIAAGCAYEKINKV